MSKSSITGKAIRRLMLDLQGLELTQEEKELLQHPMTGGVIFFSRNYESKEQLRALVEAIREVSKHPLLLAVDQEGGRVQRFRDSFVRLPAPSCLGDVFAENPSSALQSAKQLGWLMAAEIREMGIDFSFAPVLDLNYGISEVIGDRSLGRDPQQVVQLATAYIQGMKEAGMASTGKHFPGHGGVQADSHLAIPIDMREETVIWQDDIKPFAALSDTGLLDAVMPAHVIYEQVDSQPAGFSPYWLQEVLRQEIGFKGVIFSDDLTMEGASVAGGFADRAEAAFAAGCDMALVCNHREGAIEVLDQVRLDYSSIVDQRLQAMQGKPFFNQSALLDRDKWEQVVDDVTAFT